MMRESEIRKRIKERFNASYDNVANLASDKFLYLELEKYFAQHPGAFDETSQELFSFVKKSFVNLSIIYVSREIDTRHDSHSFVNLLRDIDKNYKIFKLSWFLRRYPKWMRENAKQDFKQFSTKNWILSRRSIRNDQKEIINAIKDIRKYRHKRLAHLEIRQRQFKTTIQQMFDAIDLLEIKILKYNILINQSGMSTLVPSNLSTDFGRVFKWGRL